MAATAAPVFGWSLRAVTTVRVDTFPAFPSRRKFRAGGREPVPSEPVLAGPVGGVEYTAAAASGLELAAGLPQSNSAAGDAAAGHCSSPRLVLRLLLAGDADDCLFVRGMACGADGPRAGGGSRLTRPHA